MTKQNALKQQTAATEAAHVPEALAINIAPPGVFTYLL